MPPASPMSSNLSGHVSPHQGGGGAREEGEDSDIFERDVEAAVPVSLGSSSTPSAPATSATGTAPPSPSASPLGRSAGQHPHHHLSHQTSASSSSPSAATSPSHVHHPVTRGSVTDRIFPTVLDDAVEALTASSQGGADVFVVSASQTPSRDQSPSRVFRREPTLTPRETSPPAAGGGSPRERSGGSSSHRDRRESGVSLRGQADKLLHDGSALGSPSSRSSPEPTEGVAGGQPSASLEGRLAQLASSSPSQSPRLGRSPAPSPRLAPHGLSPSASSFPSSSSIPASPFIGSGGGGPAGSPSGPIHSLSFVSPQDLITSPPLSTQSLSSITSGASLVPSINSATVAAAAAGAVDGGHQSSSSSPPPLAGGNGGQWERGGLGRGLEERLEELALRDRAELAAAGRAVSP